MDTNYLLLDQTVKSLLIKRLEYTEVQDGKNIAQRIYRQLIEKRTDNVTALLFKEKISREKQLEYLLVKDRDGRIFAHTFFGNIPPLIDSLNDRFGQDQNYRIEDKLDTPLAVYNIDIPIREGISQVGTLHIGISRDFVTDAVSPLKQATQKMIIFGLIIVSVGAGLAYALSLAITKSITKLQDWALQLSRGASEIDFKMKGNDEIAVLARSLKQMRDHIQEARRELEIQNKNLEKLVRERTVELENNNRELMQNHTKLEELNKDLEQQRQNLKIVFSAMNYPLYVINLDHSIAMMNDLAQKMCGAREELPVTCHQIIFNSETPCSEEDRPCPLRLIKRTEEPVVLEHEYIGKNDQKRTVEIHAFPIFGKNGELTQIVETCIDITEKKQAEEEKHQLENELHRAQKLESIGTLAAGVAHEINTPIQFIGDNTQFAEESVVDLLEVISGYKSLIKKIQAGEELEIDETVDQIETDGDLDYLVEELPRAIQQTKDGVEHVSQIVKAMKDFSHIGSEQKMQSADINHALETTLTISKNEWKYAADIALNLGRCLPTVECFCGRIEAGFS